MRRTVLNCVHMYKMYSKNDDDDDDDDDGDDGYGLGLNSMRMYT